jgi:sugar phosphate permease
VRGFGGHAVDAVTDRETGEATGVNTIMRNIGGAVGSQLAGSIIAAHVLGNGVFENTGFELAFLVGSVGAIVAALAVLLIPGRPNQPAAELRPESVTSAA